MEQEVVNDVLKVFIHDGRALSVEFLSVHLSRCCPQRFHALELFGLERLFVGDGGYFSEDAVEVFGFVVEFGEDFVASFRHVGKDFLDDFQLSLPPVVFCSAFCRGFIVQSRKVS